jgi:hypothetical protein
VHFYTLRLVCFGCAFDEQRRDLAVFSGELWELRTSQATAHQLRSLVKSHRKCKTLENPADTPLAGVLSVYFSINLPSTLIWKQRNLQCY